MIDAGGHVPRARESAIGMALVDGQLVAAMRRTIGNDYVKFELRPYRTLASHEADALHQAAGRYGDFLQRKATLTLS